MGPLVHWLGVLFGRPRAPSSLGDRGEQHAERLLVARGMRTIARRLDASLGEIDLVMLDGPAIVFVEVKTRRDTRAGHPVESVTPVQRRRIVDSATGFLRSRGWLDRPARIDVVGIVWPPESDEPTDVRHVRNAFEQ